ncbi:MAG: bi-domain-containing oxidoreductase [Candidatus Scalindua sp.]
MKQLVQQISGGSSQVLDVPVPETRPGMLLVQNSASLVSAGTERTAVAAASESLIGKARSRPDLVRQTVDKARREGIMPTIESVKQRLSGFISLGYSSAGTVIDIGEKVKGFKRGDLVACAGAGYAVHAETVIVPKNLVVKINDGVDIESAAFTTLGAIAMQGIRLAEVRLGEVVGVIGLGLLGQLTIQMLKAAGCIVACLDIQNDRTKIAEQFGIDSAASTAEGFITICRQLSNGRGIDAVLITADTRSNEPVKLAGEVARDKGIIVAVGTVGMSIPRKVYFEKELIFRISRSYGPGRYDPMYEEKGYDYPYGYVRWTEQRNMQAFVQMLADSKINVQPLITHRLDINEAPKAYDLITGKTEEPFLGVLLKYAEKPDIKHKILMKSRSHRLRSTIDTDKAKSKLDLVSLGVLGAGNFTSSVMLPVIKDIKGINLTGIASARGTNARSLSDRFGFDYCATDENEIINDPNINTIAIMTRHYLHAQQVIDVLKARKNVFVEKPLCLNEEELKDIISTYYDEQERNIADGVQSLSLMVGFNRRFAPFIIELKGLLNNVREPLVLNYRINAGYIPANHWTQDPQVGGGRLVGEACHFIDLLIYLSGSKPYKIMTYALPDKGHYSQDNLHITLEFANRTLGTVTYVANGDKGFGKECLEVFGGGLSARLDDYRTLLIQHGKKKIKRTNRLRQDKGIKNEWQSLVDYLTGSGPVPISFEEIICSTEATLAAQLSLEKCEVVTLGGHYSGDKA